MAMINVNSDIQDGFYRYKMPKLMAKVEGKGNGIKTVITNMREIATALGRPPMYPTKYFGCELGAQTQFDPKNDRYIVNGAHESDRLQTLLFSFIKKFVLCSSCDNPETVLHVREKKGVTATCKACGNAFTIDPVHRLTQYILKNPCADPDAPSNSSATKGKSGKRSKRQAKATDSPQDTESANNTTDVNGTAAGDDSSDNAGNNGAGNDEDDDWAGDTSKEAQEKRMAEISMSARALTINDDLEKSENERADIFYSYVKKLYDEYQDKIKTNEKAIQIKGEAVRLELGDMAVMILAEVLWNKPETIVELIKTSTVCLRKFTEKNTKAQMHIIGAAEKTIEKWQNILLPKAVHIFKALYDSDIVEEEVFLQWANRGPSKRYILRALSTKIHDAMKPLIKWLKEAEEESSEEDDDDDDDDEPEVNSKVREVKSTSVSAANAQISCNGSGENDEDDIDIDAI